MKEKPLLRNYELADRVACLKILYSNMPRYFVTEDERDFARFLDHLPGPYVVLEYEGEVVGCGGWAFSESKTRGHLTWGMIDLGFHRKGLGTVLLHYRMEALRSAGVSEVQLNTTQHVSAFFERSGFVIVETVIDDYAPGLDRVGMVFRFE